MLPYITIGDLKIPFFTVGFSLTAILFIFLVVHSARRRGIDENSAIEIAAIISVSAIIFSKVPLGIIYGWDIKKFFKFWESGHSLFSGLIVGAVITYIYCILRKIDFYDVLASLSYPAFFTLSAYRILVCLPSGCCFGFPSSFGIKFSHESWAGKILGGTPKLFPSQIVESAMFLLGGLILYNYEKKERRRSEDTILLFLFLLSVERAVAEFIRYDIKEKIIKAGEHGISIWLVISLLLFSATSIYFKYLIPWIKEVKEILKGE